MSKGLRIGVFGGTFDPMHNTHVDIARAALVEARLDRVLFVVSARPPHKYGRPCASPEERYAMAAAVAAEEPKFEASRIEIDRAGPSYTADTLDAIGDSYPDASLFLILGLDSFLDLPHWKNPERILSRARLLVVKRPRLRQKFPEVLEGHYDLLPFSETELSSTRVRDRIESGAPFDDLVPEPVARLITAKRIYRVDR